MGATIHGSELPGARVTLLTQAEGELRRVARALGHDAERVAGEFAGLVAPCAWPLRSAGEGLLPSGLSHRCPFSMSVVCGAGHGELRSLVEAQATRDDANAYWHIGRAMTAWIGRREGADVTRFEAIADDFIPDGRAPFRVWHGASWGGAGAARYRVYVSARANREAPPSERIERALTTLGRQAAWESVVAALRPVDHPTILSLDLGAPHRVKIYVLHPDARWNDLRRLWQLAGADAPPAERFVALMSDEAPRWWLTGITLGERGPTSVALHFGAGRHLRDDEARRRFEGLARELGVDSAPYRALLQEQPKHHFFSYQSWGGGPRLTAYQAPTLGGTP